MSCLAFRPGDFVGERSLLGEIWCDSQRDDLPNELKDAISIGTERTHEEDIEFGFQQLGLIAVRSMSPAINAVGTALDALSYLLASLVRLGGRKIPSPYRRDEHGIIRVITPEWNMQELTDGVLDPIRVVVADNSVVVARMMHGLAESAEQVDNREMRDALLVHLERFAESALESCEGSDRARICEIYRKLTEKTRLDRAG